jgi:bacterioferritin-associated ferredoxin
MYICMCNPFTDKDLDGALKDEKVAKKTSAVYKACSGGEKPCCGTCICEIRDRIEAHNNEILVMAAE